MKLTKKKATEFFKSFIGNANGMELDPYSVSPSYVIKVGLLRYEIWVIDGRIACNLIIGAQSIGIYFFDFETLKPDWDWYEKRKAHP